MITMYPVYKLSILYVLKSCVLLTLGFARVNANGETKSITLKLGDLMNLSSPNYPDNYNNNLEIHWDVRADLAQRILVTFDDFHTEDSDYLRIEEENYPSSEAKYSGSKGIPPYLSLGNHLSIIFMSDSSQSKTGFCLSLSCLTHSEDNTYIHEALEGSEHIRVLTQPLCRNAWHMDVADTICREAGFPGAYKTTGSNTTSGLNGTSYDCNTFTHRLQDCENFTSICTDAYNSVVIKCNALSPLGCFNLAEYTHLLSRSIRLSRDQCLTHCNSHSGTPKYAVHHNGTNCSCINQTALNVTELPTDRNQCKTKQKPTGHWATLFNVSFGFCSEPPELHKGSWNNTLNGLYGTTITAKCNENYELVGVDGKMRCDKATTSTTQDFEWHGTIPSCQQRNTGNVLTWTIASSKTTAKVNGTNSSETRNILLGVLTPVIIIIIIFTCFILWKNRESLWFLRRYQINVDGESEGRSRRTTTHSPEDTSGFHPTFGIFYSNRVVENEYIPSIPDIGIVTTSDVSEYPTSINHLIRSEVSRQDHSLSTVSTSFRPTENSTNDIPTINPLQTASSVDGTENTPMNDQTISDLAIYSSAQTLPSAQVSPRSRTFGAYVPSVCPLTLRPLPLRPISMNRTYAKLGTQSDRVNPCQPINKEQSYQGHKSIKPTDTDVSDTALGLLTDPGGADFDRRMRHTQRSSPCYERKYYSIHDPRPQNESEEIQTSEGQTPSSHDPFDFTLEREDDDTTEMIVNPLYESAEPYI